MSTAKLTGRVALVTGGGSGIGRAVAVRFADEGAQVIVNDVNLEGAEETVRLMGGAERGYAVRADVAESAEVRRMFQEAERRYDRLDVLVNNAGIAEISPGRFEEVKGRYLKIMGEMMAGGPRETHLDVTCEMDDEDWDRMLRVHLFGTFYCTREALKVMGRKGSGAVVNMSSIAGLSGLPGVPHYSAAKAGIIGFTRAVAVEVASRGIRVNAVCPGWIETPLAQPVLGDPTFAMSQLMRTPMSRFGKPEEIAAAVLYLASDESSFVTGQCLSPNGGYFIG